MSVVAQTFSLLHLMISSQMFWGNFYWSIQMMNEMQRACIEACNACYVSCLQCVAACLKESDVKSMTNCIALDLECAEICRLCVSSMARNGACMKQICDLCAKACDMCAAECAKHAHAHCKECADACKRCAEACRAMA